MYTGQCALRLCRLDTRILFMMIMMKDAHTYGRLTEKTCRGCNLSKNLEKFLC